MRSRSPVFEGLEIWGCTSCGMRFVAPLPSGAALDSYNAAYFKNAHAGDADSEAARAFHSGVNRIRVEYVERIRQAENADVRRILEIGPGRGDFARHWRARHSTTDYHIIESDVSCHPELRAAGLQVHAAQDELGDAGLFDLLVISHVLEHTRDPAAFLLDALRFVRPGGLVFIEVPCRDDEHKFVHEPHLLFFDRLPMEKLLERCGVQPLRISYHGLELERLRAGLVSKPSLARRIADRLVPIAERLGLLPMNRGDLALIEDPLARAGVRRLDAHLEKPVPAWWLRAVGRRI